MNLLAETVRRAAATPSGAAGGLTLLALALTALVAAMAGPDPLAQDLSSKFAAPGPGHILGTDYLGRDILARVGEALRGSLGVAFAVALISGAAGGLIGLASGYAGGWADMVAQRLVDALMALPVIVLALAIVASTGPSKVGVLAALSVAFMPMAVRVTRASALSLRSAGYAEAARAMGARPWAVLFNHVLPNAAGPWVVVLSAQVGGALLAEASLSFLGAGARGAGSLGAMLGREAQVYMHSSPWMVVWPGLALAGATMAANLIGDAVAGTVAAPSTRPWEADRGQTASSPSSIPAPVRKPGGPLKPPPP
jgi:peptide/nickel transport system permease protein